MRKTITLIFSSIFPRVQDALFAGILIAVAIQGASLLNGDGDLGRHITIGSYILKNWKIPTRDIFSHTMTGSPLVPHEWLAQVAFSSVHNMMGLTGVVLLTALLIATAFTCVYRQMLKGNVFRILALTVTLLAAYTSSLHWLTRPHIFTFLFTAIWMCQLENEKSRVWSFPLIMLIWVNTHGAFIAGFVIWGAYMLGWLWEYLHGQSTKETGVRLAIIGVASFAVTFINPAGWHLWGTSVGYLGNQFLVDQTIEYQSPDFHARNTWPFLIMLASYILASGVGNRSRPHESLLVAGWAVMSLYSARNIPLFAIIAAPYIGAGIQGIAEQVSILGRFDQTLSNIESKSIGL
ncbi:MAG TPA: hypothetical protein VHP14_03515, partial [Anaerolineales bacterium]|nr:hypothetical protein [Anaerolineales bacterium]